MTQRYEMCAPKWRTKAAQELSRFRRAAAVLPLAEALFRPAKMVDGLELAIERRTGLGDHEAMLMKCAEALSSLKRGRGVPIAMNPRVASLSSSLRLAMPRTFDRGHSDKKIGRISSIWKAGMAHHSMIMENARAVSTVMDTLASEIVAPALRSSGIYDLASIGYSAKENSEALQRDAGAAADIVVSGAVMNDISRLVTPEEIADLMDLAEAGIERVQRYEKLKRSLEKERNLHGRQKGRKAMFTLACPEALAALREQSEIRPVRHEAPAEMPEEPVAPSPEARTARSEKEDIEMLKRGYPRLYRRMMEPTAAELEAKRLKKTVRDLRRQEGMSYDEIRRRLTGDAMVHAPSIRPETPEPATPSLIRLKRTRKRVAEEKKPDAPAEPQQKRPRKHHELDDVKRWGWKPNDFHQLLNQYGFDTSEVGGGGHCFVKYQGERLRQADGRSLTLNHRTTGTEITPGMASKVLKACADFLVENEHE